MRVRADFQRWDVEVDEDAQTCVYFEPVATMQPQPAPPIVQRVDYTPPAPMPMHTLPAPARMTSPQPTRIVARRRSRAGIGILVASTCVAVGIVLGTLLASNGSTRVASEAPAAPAVAIAPAPVATVTPIEVPAPPPPAAIVAPVEPPPAPPIAQPAPVAAPVEPPATASRRAHHHRVHAAPTAIGTLAVSSKPPCAIYVDGKDTGLVAPQRAIELAVGTHQVTLVNAEQGIHLTQEVEISADRATKVVRDFTE